jgi:hypothetical protein
MHLGNLMLYRVQIYIFVILLFFEFVKPAPFLLILIVHRFSVLLSCGLGMLFVHPTLLTSILGARNRTKGHLTAARRATR